MFTAITIIYDCMIMIYNHFVKTVQCVLFTTFLDLEEEESRFVVSLIKHSSFYSHEL